MTRRTLGAQAGSASLELLLVGPLLLALAAFITGAARINTAERRTVAATRDAARAASLARTPHAARTAAVRAARASLGAQASACQPLSVDVDVRGFRPGGAVTVRIRCTARLADLAVPGAPGTVTLASRQSAPVDPFRELG